MAIHFLSLNRSLPPPPTSANIPPLAHIPLSLPTLFRIISSRLEVKARTRLCLAWLWLVEFCLYRLPLDSACLPSPIPCPPPPPPPPFRWGCCSKQPCHTIHKQTLVYFSLVRGHRPRCLHRLFVAVARRPIAIFSKAQLVI